MKYRLNFELKENVFKKDYRRIIISFFKKAISESMEEEYYRELYESGAKKKNFVWSVGFNQPKFKGEIMELAGNKFQITMKFSDVGTAFIYSTSFISMKNKPFPVGDGNYMILRSINSVDEVPIREDVALFKILSPICIRLHNEELNKDRYITCEDENFVEELKNKLKEELPYDKSEVDSLEFYCEHLKLVVVSAFGLKIPASIGYLSVNGSKKVLNHMRESGVGSRKNAGFGLLEVM